MLRRRRCALGAIEGIHHQHGIALARQASRHVLERRTQSENIGPDEYRGSLALGRMYEECIRGAIGSFDVDIRLGQVRGTRECRHEYAEPRSYRERTKLPS